MNVLHQLKEQAQMRNNKKTTNNKSTMKAADTLLLFVAQVIVVIALIEPLMTTDNEIYRGAVGAAMAYVALTLAIFSYRNIIKPSAKAIIASVGNA